MPFYKRFYSPGRTAIITTSTYRRAPLFLSERFCRCFVRRLVRLRQETKFVLIGWVLMPDHFHLLLNPAERDRRNHPPDPEEAKRSRRPTVFYKQSGMFWTVWGTKAILTLRCCQFDGRFEDYWEARRA